MSQKLVSHNEDLGRLVARGYALAVDGGFLIVRDIPYLDASLCLRVGAIVSKYVDIDGSKIQQEDHQVFFAGSHPHGLDGTPIPNLGGGPVTVTIGNNSNDIVIERSFSNKPRPSGVFADFFAKIESYVAIIAGPAIEKYGATPYTFRQVGGEPSTSVFKFQDTLSSRAEILDLSNRFSNDVVAVVGLGGSGSYLLDLLVKTPVREIRAFDADEFHVHNAFRSPGRLDPLIELGRKKVDVYQGRYENFRHGLVCKPFRVDEDTAEDLDGVTFAFVCVDKGTSRASVFAKLIARGIPFIDVGLGLDRKHGTLGGMLRATYFSVENAHRILQKQWVNLIDTDEGLYHTNIQIAELNAMNACLALIRFKQIRGFYTESDALHNMILDVSSLKVFSEGSLED